jgi:hypothetical protein
MQKCPKSEIMKGDVMPCLSWQGPSNPPKLNAPCWLGQPKVAYADYQVARLTTVLGIHEICFCRFWKLARPTF